MKKLSFFLMAMLMSVMSFAETELFTQTYPGSPSTYTNAYTKSFTVTTGDYTLTYTNINNGQESNAWTAIRSGSKNGASVATIASEQIAAPIAKVVINFIQANASSTNALYLEVSANSDFSSATKIAADIAVGNVEFPIAAPAANQYYKITIDQAKGSANGFNRFDKVVFYQGEAAGEDVEIVAAPEFSVTEANFTTAFTLDITSEEGTTLKYTIDNTDPSTSATAIEVATNSTSVQITKSTAVKAIAIKGELKSVTKSKVYCYVNSAETAYTVAEAMEVIDAGLGLANELYVKGEISEIEKFDANYGSITYWIKDEEGNKFECYSGLGLNKAKFTSVDDLVVGSKVVVCGVMKKYDTTYEFNYNNYIVSLELPVAKFTVTATAENGTVAGAGEYEENAEATLTATANEGYEFVNWTSGETEVSTANPFTFTVTSDTTLVANFKEVVVEEPVEAKLYLTPNANWKQGNARFAAYFFGNGETWVGMTKVAGETDLYEVTIPTDKKYPNVIFCRMNPGAAANNWNNKWNQTSDLVIPTDGKNHYTVKENTWDKGGGTWSVWPLPVVRTYVDVTITVTANAPASIKWANAGDKLADATDYVAMTAGENNTYTYTLAQVDEATGVDYTIKVGDFVSVEQNTSKNVTIDFKDLLPQVAVQGVNNWDGTDKMTIADDYLTASITLPLVAKKYDLKLTVGGAWKGHKTENHITREKNSSVFKNDDGNGSITADIAGDYVFTYTYATQTLTVTYPELAPVYNVTVADATVSTMGQNIVLSGNWEEKLLTVSLWQGGATQGFGTYAAEDYAPIFLGTAELTPTSEGVYADNGDGTFTFTATATDAEGAIYNITLTGANPAAVEPETVEIEATVPFNVENGELYIDACEKNYAWCLNFTISGYDGYGNYEVAGLYSTDNDYSVFGTLNVSYDESQETDMIMGTLKTADESLVVHVTLYKEAAGEGQPTVLNVTDLVVNPETAAFEGTCITEQGMMLTLSLVPDLQKPVADKPMTYELNLEKSSIQIAAGLRPTPLTLTSGEIATDYATPAAVATVAASLDAETFLFTINMTAAAAEAIEIELEATSAVVDEDVLTLYATYEDEEGDTYPVAVELQGFENVVGDKEYKAEEICKITIGNSEVEEELMDVAYANSVMVIIGENGEISLEGEFSSWESGSDYYVTITGSLNGKQEPEYEVFEDVINNLVVTDEMAFIGGPSTTFGLEIFFVPGQKNANGTIALDLEQSSMARNDNDLTIVSGYLKDIDLSAPAANAVVVAQLSESETYEFHLTMTGTPAEAVEIVITDATVVIDSELQSSDSIMGDVYNYALTMTADWTNPADGLTYPVKVEVLVYDPNVTEQADAYSNVNVGDFNSGAWLGGADGCYLNLTTVDGVITAKGVVNTSNGVAINLTISGKLPATALDNIQVGVETVKVIRNGQLIIIKNGVEYNVQGAILK